MRMHTESGLLDDIPGGIPLADAGVAVLAYVRGHVAEAGRAPLAGSSVYVDRGLPRARTFPTSTRTCTTASSTCPPSRSWPAAGTRGRTSTRRRSPAGIARWPTSGSRSRSCATTAARCSCPPGTVHRRGSGGGEHHVVDHARGLSLVRPGALSRVHFTPAERRYSHRTMSAPGDGGCSSAGRAPGCGPGGRGFESRHSPWFPGIPSNVGPGHSFARGRRGATPGSWLSSAPVLVDRPVLSIAQCISIATCLTRARCCRVRPVLGRVPGRPGRGRVRR